MQVNISPRFKRAYKKLPDKIKDDFDKKVVIFMENPRDPRIKAHKLQGKLQYCLSFLLPK